MTLVRKIVSLGYWLLDKEKSLDDFQKKTQVKNLKPLEVPQSHKNPSGLILTAHVYYEDFVVELIEGLKQYPKDTTVLGTTPSKVIKSQLDVALGELGLKHDVRVTPNRGRNFGPLLVEFSEQLKNTESFIHVHSKKSEHSPHLSDIWLKRNTTLFFSKPNVSRFMDLTFGRPRIGLVYSDASDLVRGINLRWGRSRRSGMNLLENLDIRESVRWSGKLMFPIGGMFWVKTQAIRQLLDISWKYEMFPVEEGQMDGTLQHGLERLIGELTLANGFAHLVYDSDEDQFFIQPESMNSAL